MRWTHKAWVQRLCAEAPGGDIVYRLIQRRLGTLTPDPFRRLPQLSKMLRGLVEQGVTVSGARCLEVGTGHLPIAPVGFWLAGASEVLTVDLHRRLDLGLTSSMLAQLAAERERVAKAFRGLVDADDLQKRLALVGTLAERPEELFDRIGLRYNAPGDAADLPDDGGSFDVHFSMTVLEHIEPVALGAVLAEARRLLAPDGMAVHFVDPSDHFAHQDDTITRINFLRFSEREWQRIAGNEFSYTNRLRAPHLEQAFRDAGFTVERSDRGVDERSLAAVRDGFPLNPAFRRMDVEDLCTTTVRVYARPTAPLNGAAH